MVMTMMRVVIVVCLVLAITASVALAGVQRTSQKQRPAPQKRQPTPQKQHQPTPEKKLRVAAKVVHSATKFRSSIIKSFAVPEENPRLGVWNEEVTEINQIKWTCSGPLSASGPCAYVTKLTELSGLKVAPSGGSGGGGGTLKFVPDEDAIRTMPVRRLIIDVLQYGYANLNLNLNHVDTFATRELMKSALARLQAELHLSEKTVAAGTKLIDGTNVVLSTRPGHESGERQYAGLSQMGHFLQAVWAKYRAKHASTRGTPLKIAVAGAGPTGLVTAALLALEGHKLKVFEKRGLDVQKSPNKHAFERDQVLRLDRVVMIQLWLSMPCVMDRLFRSDISPGVLLPQNNPLADEQKDKEQKRRRGDEQRLDPNTEAAHIRIGVFQHVIYEYLTDAHWTKTCTASKSQSAVKVASTVARAAGKFKQQSSARRGTPLVPSSAPPPPTKAPPTHDAWSTYVHFYPCSEVKGFDVTLDVKPTRGCDDEAPRIADFVPDIVVAAEGSRSNIREQLGFSYDLAVDPVNNKLEHSVWGLIALYKAGKVPPLAGDTGSDGVPLGGRNAKFIGCERVRFTSTAKINQCLNMGAARSLVVREFFNYGYAPLKMQNAYYFGIGFSDAQLARFGLVTRAERLHDRPPTMYTAEFTANAHTQRVKSFMSSSILPYEFTAEYRPKNDDMIVKKLFPWFVDITLKSSSGQQKLERLQTRRKRGGSSGGGGGGAGKQKLRLYTVEGDGRGTANYLRASGMNHALRSFFPNRPLGMSAVGSDRSISAPSLSDIVHEAEQALVSGNLDRLDAVAKQRAIYSKFLVHHLAASGKACLHYINTDDVDRSSEEKNYAPDDTDGCFPQLVGSGAYDFIEWLAWSKKENTKLNKAEACAGLASVIFATPLSLDAVQDHLEIYRKELNPLVAWCGEDYAVFKAINGIEGGYLKHTTSTRERVPPRDNVVDPAYEEAEKDLLEMPMDVAAAAKVGVARDDGADALAGDLKRLKESEQFKQLNSKQRCSELSKFVRGLAGSQAVNLWAKAAAIESVMFADCENEEE